jgi:hypothetical protein
MTGRRLGALAVLSLVAVAIAGCGGTSAPQRTPAASSIPLLPGSRVVQQVRRCDQGTNAFCAVDLVVRNPRYDSSDVLAHQESKWLRQHGWSLADGDTSVQSGANSPGHKLRLTFTSAADDLQEIDLGIIIRPWPITYALSTSMFDRAAAMSMRLEVGAS